jgi:hypothetical protein
MCVTSGLWHCAEVSHIWVAAFPEMRDYIMSQCIRSKSRSATQFKVSATQFKVSATQFKVSAHNSKCQQHNPDNEFPGKVSVK